jgi:hypothetical protein
MPHDVDPAEEQRHQEAVELLSDLQEVVLKLAALDDLRDRLIVQASEAGASRATVARVTGLTRGRIQQIVTAHRAQTGGPAPDAEWQAHGKTKGSGDDPSRLERASRRRARADRKET